MLVEGTVASNLAGMLYMPYSRFVLFVAAVALLTLMPAASAEIPHAFGRYHGTGWSDGYHSHAACPPKRRLLHHSSAPAPASVPWWTIPAPDAEPLAPPSHHYPGATRNFPPTGPSLFRQPGEGSSVTVAGMSSASAASR